MILRGGGSAFLLALFAASLCFAQQPQQQDTKRPWKGYAILGNGHLTAVYSDDSRIESLTHQKGIQHFYFADYTADYVASTSFEPIGRNAGAPRVGMRNFFTAQTITSLGEVRCFVHPDDALVLSLSAGAPNRYRFEARLRKEIKTDALLSLTSLKTVGSAAVAVWSNGIVLAIAPKDSNAKVTVSGSSVVITGSLQRQADVLLIPASSRAEALSKVQALRHDPDLEATAAKFWEAWMNHGILPKVPNTVPDPAAYLEAYKRNLYCVKAAALNGQIPADITGQFVTNNMPQLYPRDAMMCARVLLETGHPEEARQVIEFWANDKVPRKTPGEWYARYDAHGQPVDAGSGARFDEPEWDANGYFIYLLAKYHESKGVWLADRKLIYQLADFLVAHLSAERAAGGRRHRGVDRLSTSHQHDLRGRARNCLEDRARIRRRIESANLCGGIAKNCFRVAPDVRRIPPDLRRRSLHRQEGPERREPARQSERKDLSVGYQRQLRRDLGLSQTSRIGIVESLSTRRPP